MPIATLDDCNTTTGGLHASQQFAALSGDCNPLHLDPIVARRLVTGEPVVHGVRMALAGLEGLLKERCTGQSARRLQRLRCQFVKPARLDDVLTVNILTADAEQFDVTVGGAACRVAGRWATEEGRDETNIVMQTTWDEPCREPTFDEAARASGVHPLVLDQTLLATLFPRVAQGLSPVQTAQILATTRLTGMQCPGRHTIFDSFDLQFGPLAAADVEAADMAMRYRVVRADRRFSLIEIEIESPGLEGRLRTFYRPPPVEQLPLAEIRRLVRPDEFASHKALVIGGSRGMGEATAKLVAAGGGEVRLTYRTGADDAHRVVAELRSNGAAADAFRLDVTTDSPRTLQAGLGDWRPTHVYYFATPKHNPLRADDAFAPSIAERFRACYVTGLRAVVEGLDEMQHASDRIAMLFPSAAFVDAPPKGFAECAAAKLEAEALCRELAKRFSRFRFRVPRWPRLRTDQNAAIAPVRVDEPAEVMLGELRGTSLDR